MKKALLIAVALCMCHTVFSQEMGRIKLEATSEIKLNLAMLLGSLPEISYERIWANNFGLGASLRVGFSDDYDTKYQVTPYCRFYFGESSFKSFFIEGNMAVIGYKKSGIDYYSNSYTSQVGNAVDVGVGLAVGYRYVNRRGLVGEVFLGLGRTTDDRVYSRCGISMGKLF
jgi:hypothetical protein